MNGYLKLSLIMPLILASHFAFAAVPDLKAELSGVSIPGQEIEFLQSALNSINADTMLKMIAERYQDLAIVILPTKIANFKTPLGLATFNGDISWQTAAFNEAELKWFIDRESKILVNKQDGQFMDPYKLKNQLKFPNTAKAVIFIRKNMPMESISHEVLHYLIYKAASINPNNYLSHLETYLELIRVNGLIPQKDGQFFISAPQDFTNYLDLQLISLRFLKQNFEEVDVTAISLSHFTKVSTTKPLMYSSIIYLNNFITEAITEFNNISTAVTNTVSSEHFVPTDDDKQKLAELSRQLVEVSTALGSRQNQLNSEFVPLLKP